MSKITAPYEPTPFQIAAARAVMARYREDLIAMDEAFVDDEQLLIDVIDGQTDYVELLDTAVIAVDQLEANVEAIDAQIARLNVRKARFSFRNDRLRVAILETAKALGVTSMKRALYTLTINKGRTSVDVTAPDDLPQGYFKLVRQPDKAAIKTTVEAKADVPGAQLVTGNPSLTLRLK
jgi:hypothetical protein